MAAQDSHNTLLISLTILGYSWDFLGVSDVLSLMASHYIDNHDKLSNAGQVTFSGPYRLLNPNATTSTFLGQILQDWPAASGDDKAQTGHLARCHDVKKQRQIRFQSFINTFRPF